MKVWAPEQDFKELSPSSPIRKRYVGPAWWLEMYKILSRSRITLNHHGNFAPYANNRRLITDSKKDLHEMFTEGKEVVAYNTTEECIELIQYYLEHEEEGQAIARAGQDRTLQEHSCYERTREILDIVRKYQ